MIDEEKRRRIRAGLEREGMSALVLRYPENVVYATSYWPCFGWSTCIYPLDGEPVLLIPECEGPYAERAEFADRRALRGDYLGSTAQAVSEILAERDLQRSTIGLESSFETIAANQVGGEANFPNAPTFERLRAELPGCRMVDATGLLYELRSIKSEAEIEKLKLANRLGAQGLEAARDALKPGRRETELASEVERAIHTRGVGYRGTLRARGFAFIMSGPLSAQAHMPFNISTKRRIRKGDLVLLELNTYADGYWSDLTRVWSCGRPTQRQLEIYGIVLEAQRESLRKAGDGIAAEEPYLAAKGLIERRGYGKYYPHYLGHGVGARMHEPIPSLGPGSDGALRKGMVHSAEPGIYIPKFGGIRIEDNVVERDKGAVSLSTFERTLET
jgi:Xaa-Pro dipeptidase